MEFIQRQKVIIIPKSQNVQIYDFQFYFYQLHRYWSKPHYQALSLLILPFLSNLYQRIFCYICISSFEIEVLCICKVIANQIVV